MISKSIKKSEKVIKENYKYYCEYFSIQNISLLILMTIEMFNEYSTSEKTKSSTKFLESMLSNSNTYFLSNTSISLSTLYVVPDSNKIEVTSVLEE